MLITSFARSLLEMAFVPECLGCEDALPSGQMHLCPACHADLERLTLGHPVENPVGQKLGGRIPLRFASALYPFKSGGKAQHIIHALKYNHQPEACRYFGGLLGHKLLDEGVTEAGFAAIGYVPIHPRKLRIRGYNQAEEIAIGVSQATRLPLIDASRRTVFSESQTRQGGRRARWQNLEGVFGPRPGAELEERAVLLVDDVLTTGATLERLAQVHLQMGCPAIGVAVLANVE